MRLDEECRLSFYQQIASLNEDHGVYLVQNISDKKISQIAITSWTPRGKNLAHGWSRRIYP